MENPAMSARARIAGDFPWEDRRHEKEWVMEQGSTVEGREEGWDSRTP